MAEKAPTADKIEKVESKAKEKHNSWMSKLFNESVQKEVGAVATGAGWGALSYPFLYALGVTNPFGLAIAAAVAGYAYFKKNPSVYPKTK